MARMSREEEVARTLAQREDSVLFRSLSPELQEEFRARLRGDLERRHARDDLDGKGLAICIGQSLAIHLIDALVLDAPSLAGTLLALVLGSLVGALWWKTRAGYLGGVLFALPGWIAVKWLAGFQNGYALLFGSVLFVCMCAVAGLLRDLRRNDGGTGL